MKHRTTTLVSAILISVCCAGPLYSQSDDYEKVNSNLGVAMGVPVNSTGKYAGLGWGLTTGVGYNLNKTHGFVGEVMWTRLYPSSYALSSLNTVLPSTNADGFNDVYGITANYRYELRGNRFGTYLIGGGGWYYRDNSFSEVTLAAGTACTPGLLWWGVTCKSGSVPAAQTIRSSNSSAFGGNAGVGFTVKVGEPSYRLYVESRYHYAPTKGVSTQLVNVTV
jgi:hypothetical protein